MNTCTFTNEVITPTLIKLNSSIEIKVAKFQLVKIACCNSIICDSLQMPWGGVFGHMYKNLTGLALLANYECVAVINVTRFKGHLLLRHSLIKKI